MILARINSPFGGFINPIIITTLYLCLLLLTNDTNPLWRGGRITNDSAMYKFESISILMNLFLSWVLLMKGEFVQFKFHVKKVNRFLWIFFGLFILNTVGNIFAKTNFEKLFALLTGLSAILIWNILKHKKTTNR